MLSTQAVFESINSSLSGPSKEAAHKPSCDALCTGPFSSGSSPENTRAELGGIALILKMLSDRLSGMATVPAGGDDSNAACPMHLFIVPIEHVPRQTATVGNTCSNFRLKGDPASFPLELENVPS